MDTSILKEYSPETVSPAIEQNNLDLFIFAADRGSKTLVIEKDISWVIAKPFWPSYLLHPCFESENIDERLRFIGSRIEERSLPPVLKFGPKGKPIDLAHHLQQNGFMDMGYHPPGMAIDLEQMRKDFPKPANLEIQTVGCSESLRSWISMFTTFELEMFKKLVSEPQLKLYLGIVEGKPVATSMLFLSSGVAGIYHVGVDPEYRRKGIGTAITLAPLLDARDIGYHIGVLQASDMGESIYRRIGFEEFFKYQYFK